MSKSNWTDQEIRTAISMKSSGKTLPEISKALNRSYNSVSVKLSRAAVPESVMPLWNSPLESDGDAVILSDIEAPFQNGEFINRVLDLADAWKIKTLHLAGDLLHYDNLSAWGSEWTESQEDLRDMLLEFMTSLNKNQREKGVKIMEEKGILTDTSYTGEMKEARKVFKSLGQFDEVYVALGNHDDRYLRALDQAMAPSELLHQIDKHNDPRWKIAPYYYTILHTKNGDFRITHPRGAGAKTAIDLAIQFHQHIIMGHSHRWNISRDPSAKYWAIQTGHCVDENRLAYVQQRDARREAHMNGATIVRDGYPFVLHNDSPWKLLKKM